MPQVFDSFSLSLSIFDREAHKCELGQWTWVRSAPQFRDLGSSVDGPVLTIERAIMSPNFYGLYFEMTAS